MKRCPHCLTPLLIAVFFGWIEVQGQVDPVPVELAAVLDSGPPRLVWDPTVLEPSDRVRIEVYESADEEWRLLGECSASQGYFRIYPFHLDPAQYRLVVEERYTLVPLEVNLQRETLLKATAGALDSPRVMQIDFRFDPEGSWIHHGIMESASQSFFPVDASLDYLDVRFRYDNVDEEEYVPAEEIIHDFYIQYNWDLADAQPDYLTLSFQTDGEYQVFQTIEADQESITIPLEDLPEQYAMPLIQAWSGETPITLARWLKTYYEVTWSDQPDENIVGYQVETWTGYPRNITIAHPALPIDSRHYSGHIEVYYPTTDFVRVRRLSAWENRVHDDFFSQLITESFSWDSEDLPDNPLALQWRDANHEQWKLREYLRSRTFQANDRYAVPHIREYRIMEARPRQAKWVAGEVSVPKNAVPHPTQKSWATLKNNGATVRMWYPTQNHIRYILQTSLDGSLWGNTSIELDGKGIVMPVEAPIPGHAKSTMFRLKAIGDWF